MQNLSLFLHQVAYLHLLMLKSSGAAAKPEMTWTGTYLYFTNNAEAVASLQMAAQHQVPIATNLSKPTLHQVLEYTRE